MHIVIRESAQNPIYQQIVDSFSRDIRSGTLPAGYRLPAVRKLSDQMRISKGTVKHAYDILEQLGLIEKTQGRGTYVRDLAQDVGAGKKERALLSIGQLLNEMEAMQFSPQEIRIFFDLMLRQREEINRGVKVGIIDCSPEALSLIRDQLSEIENIDLYKFPLDGVMEMNNLFNPRMDFLVTTPTHYQELLSKIQPDCKLLRIVLSIFPGTVLEMARIPEEASVGILCVSLRFAEIISHACEQYSAAKKNPERLYFGDVEAVKQFAERMEIIVLPSNYSELCSSEEKEVIGNYTDKTILYQYKIERGSLLYIKEQIDEKMAEKSY